MPGSRQILREFAVVYGCLWLLVTAVVAVTVAVRHAASACAAAALSQGLSGMEVVPPALASRSFFQAGSAP
jgi:hypothetical protein